MTLLTAVSVVGLAAILAALGLGEKARQQQEIDQARLDRAVPPRQPASQHVR